MQNEKMAWCDAPYSDQQKEGIGSLALKEVDKESVGFLSINEVIQLCWPRLGLRQEDGSWALNGLEESEEQQAVRQRINRAVLAALEFYKSEIEERVKHELAMMR